MSRPISGRYVLIGAFAVSACALALRLGLMHEPGQFDEFYHLLAARSHVENGSLAILDGSYQRASWFTIAVAHVLDTLGRDDLTGGRLLPLFAGVLLPGVVTAWLLSRCGWIPALIAAVLLVFWPEGIIESQTLRFYSWQVLCFTSGAILIFEAVNRRGSARLLAGIGGVACLFAAFYLQRTSLFGIAGIVLWLVLAVVLPAFWRSRHRSLLFAGLILVSAAAIGLFWIEGYGHKAWSIYRWTPDHALAERNNVRFYHYILRNLYSGLWWLTPVWAAIALVARPRLASYCLTIFAVCFLSQSFGGMKALRYLSYGAPFLFVLWAIAFGALLQGAVRGLDAAFGARSRGAAYVAAAALALGGAAWMLHATSFMQQSLKLALGTPLEEQPDWSLVAASLGSPSFVITSDDLRTIAAIGDYDLLFHKSILSEIGDGSDFSVDPRTGRPVIASIKALERALNCHPDGVLIATNGFWIRDNWRAPISGLFSRKGLSVTEQDVGPVVLLRWSSLAGNGGQACNPDVTAARIRS